MTWHYVNVATPEEEARETAARARVHGGTWLADALRVEGELTAEQAGILVRVARVRRGWRRAHERRLRWDCRGKTTRSA